MSTTLPGIPPKTYIKETHVRSDISYLDPHTCTIPLTDTGITIDLPELHYQIQHLAPTQYEYIYSPPLKPLKPHKGTTPKWKPPYIP